MKYHLFIILLTLFFVKAQSQNIFLTNPSFEDRPGPNRAPEGWYDCSYQFPGETPADIQPCGNWNVTRPAIDGDTYVGMVVRENNTWEAISQKLKGTLRKDSTYHFEIMICRSSEYVSATRASAMTGQKFNYTTPARLIIWGGDVLCERTEILGESEIIKNYDWKSYSFTIKPLNDIKSITMEAYYSDNEIAPYNGNILIDNATAFNLIGKIDMSKKSVKDQ